MKLPITMSPEAKNLIVHLLNRNPSKRLGAGATGADEIKQHAFFADIDWEQVKNRQLDVPAPRNSYAQFKRKYGRFECPQEQRKKIFEDAQVRQSDGVLEQVEEWMVNDWSFVGDVGRGPGAGPAGAGL